MRRIVFKVYPDEFENICKRADACGKCVSDYLRDLALAPSSQETSGELAPNALPNSVRSEVFLDERENEGSGIFGARSKNISSEVAKRIGHRPECKCFACDKLRRMIGATSAPEKKKRK